ncbi:MAG: hypothetical protein AAB531_03840 [Patescibacteria group bacterium]
MKAWIFAREAKASVPGFFRKRGKNAWRIDGKNHRIHSNFGFAEVRVQTKPDGTPDFDRAVYGESPSINAVAYGIDADGIYRVLVVFQERPFADMPDGVPADPPIVFGQPCVMAFNADKAETMVATAIRELEEEGGAGSKALISSADKMGHHNPNPTFVVTWSELFEIRVDLNKVGIPTDTEERIKGTAWLPIREVLERIGNGEHSGINYRNATANDTLFVWLARHPEALVQVTN